MMLVTIMASFRRSWWPLVWLAVVFLGLNLTVWAIASISGTPYYPSFGDMPLLLGTLLACYLLVVILWDGTLLAAGALDARKAGATATPWSANWQRLGMLPLGIWPPLMILMTGHTMLLSSNITLLSLHRIQAGISHWKDAWFWAFESGLIAWLGQHTLLIPMADWLYILCWPIQMVAMIWLFLRQRHAAKAAFFCASYGLVYFSGRLIGCLMPVLGPVFFKPEHYTDMAHTMTQLQVDNVSKMLALKPDIVQKSGILLGGISAMPSLHVAMVSLCAYWIWRETPKALPFLALWVLMTWYTTVALGWHYALDGAGAMLMVAAIMACLRPLERRWI